MRERALQSERDRLISPVELDILDFETILNEGGGETDFATCLVNLMGSRVRYFIHLNGEV